MPPTAPTDASPATPRIAGPILVTGATGFIGQRLIARLLADGYRPRALVLPSDPIPYTWGDRVLVQRGDITDRSAVARAVDGCATAFHLAAVVSDWGSPKLHQQVTVRGSENVFSAAATHNCRVLLASSVVVYGSQVQERRCDEHLPLGRPLGPYSASKLQQERLARKLEAEEGLQVTIIRPTNVFGAGSVPWVDLVVDQLRANLPVLVGGGRHCAALTHVDNVVDVFVRAAASRATIGRAYNANDDNDVTWLRYFTEIAELCGSKPPKPIARWLAHGAAFGLEAGFRATRRQGRPPLTREALNLVGSNLRIPIDRARTELGYAPIVDYNTAMREIADYLARR